MASLTDIAPAFETVEIRGVNVDVPGVPLEDIPYLLMRFSTLRDLAEAGKFTIDELADKAPEALAAVFASGLGKRGDEATEKVARDLKFGEKVDLFDAILRATVPGAFGPFVEKLKAMWVLFSPLLSAPAPSSPDKTPSANSRQKSKAML